jgi:hypothetical protein
MLRHDRKVEAGYALLAVAGTSVLAALVLHLWNASLGVPFSPGGDGYLVLMQIKGALDTGWVLSNSHLAAPFGQNLHDFAANRELLHVLVVKLIGLFTSNPATVYNVYFLLSFPLVALAAYVVMRWLGLSRPAAVAMSVLYALAPYHFRHQTFLWAYYAVPLGAYLILAIYSEAPLFERRAGRVGWPLRYASRRSLLTLGAAAAVALTSFYYAGFTVLLVLLAAAITFAVSRLKRTLAAGAAIAVAIVAIGAVAEAPDLLYRSRHGGNPVVAKRNASESQLYGTNILQLVVPVPGHRVGRLRHASERWLADTRIDGEPTHLGLIAALGFVWLLALAVVAAAGGSGRFIRDARLRHLAVATATTLLLGTTGGISGLFAYAITPQLRTWTRLAIFIAFFALAAIGLLLDAGAAALKHRGVRMPRVAVAALLVVICAIGVLDQTTSLDVPAYDANAATYRSDAAFTQAIERDVGDDGMVLQLPYVSFPESPPVGGAGPYDHVRPYLHSHGLRWSFGAMRGRATDWQADTAGAPPQQLAPAIAAAGFDGIYIDRAGYPDAASDFEAKLQQVLATAPLVSSDNRFTFFDLRPYAGRLRSATPNDQLEALADATIHPVRTDWSGGFSERHQKGLDSSRRAVVANPTLVLDNPSGAERSTDLFVKLSRAGGSAADVVITYPDRTTDRVEVPPEGVDVEKRLRLPPGQSTVQLTIQGAAIDAPEGVTGGGYLELLGWRLTPAVP